MCLGLVCRMSWPLCLDRRVISSSLSVSLPCCLVLSLARSCGSCSFPLPLLLSASLLRLCCGRPLQNEPAHLSWLLKLMGWNSAESVAIRQANAVFETCAAAGAADLLSNGLSTKRCESIATVMAM